jgi:hypothetical protein
MSLELYLWKHKNYVNYFERRKIRAKLIKEIKIPEFTELPNDERYLYVQNCFQTADFKLSGKEKWSKDLDNFIKIFNESDRFYDQIYCKIGFRVSNDQVSKVIEKTMKELGVTKFIEVRDTQTNDFIEVFIYSEPNKTFLKRIKRYFK